MATFTTEAHHNNKNGGAPLTLSPTPASNPSHFIFLDEHSFNLHKKTPLQLQTLEFLFADDKNPTKSRLEDYASALGLTYEQVRGWFIGRRRKDKQVGGRARRGKGATRSTTKAKSKPRKNKSLLNLEPSEDENISRRPVFVQDPLYSSDYIFQNLFRKDGPPLGDKFDSLPSTAFQGRKAIEDSRCSSVTTQDEPRASKRKVSKSAISLTKTQGQIEASINHGKGKGLMSELQLVNSNASCPDSARPYKRRKVLPSKNNSPIKRHGIGKGLMMMVRPQANPPAKRQGIGKGLMKMVRPHENPDSESIPNRRPQRRKPVARRRPAYKLQEKRKPTARRNKVESSLKANQKAHREICKLAFDIASCQAIISSFPALVDDEELELRELQAGQNLLTCCAHFAAGGSHGCCLCKGLLPKFPPDSVRMTKPLSIHPWNSSLELEIKLFKVFHFLYTYAVTLCLCPFTLEEFAKAFAEKESLLLGKLHICLLRLLLSDVDKELSNEFSIHSNKNGMYLNLLHMVENRRSILDFWRTSLNPLTWPEILRQVMVGAGFGSGDVMQKKGTTNKGEEYMVRYGLRPGTLKGELFTILMEKGNVGMKVTELANSSQIVDFDLGKANGELEDSISSILASDVTLFEKISSSTYRLRWSTIMKKDDDCLSDNEDFGSIDDESRNSNVVSFNNSECGSENSISRRDAGHHYSQESSSFCTEIDESHSGESWLLGLMEGEYSALCIEEKLDALLALVDLLGAGSSMRIKDLPALPAERVPRVYPHGSGGKIKPSTVRQSSLQTLSCGDLLDTCDIEQGRLSLESCPVDSSVVLAMLCDKEKDENGTSTKDFPHSMQSIFLGSDRRYNRYWLFLGPCDADDSGHTRVYFESSEDGHWQVVESEKALCGLVAVLNSQGRREAVLLSSLEQRMPFILEEMSKRINVDPDISHSTQSGVSEIDRVNVDSLSPISEIDNNHSSFETSCRTAIPCNAAVYKVDKTMNVQKQNYVRLQAYDSWIWNYFYSALNVVKNGKQPFVESLTRCRCCHDLYWRDGRHCKTCHTTFELDFDMEEKYAIHVAVCQGPDDADICPSKVFPSELQALKAAIHAIELAMHEDALIEAWRKCAHKLWVRRLRRTSSLHELLQVLADFVGAINVNWLSQCNAALSRDSILEDAVACYENMPQTSSALALWLVKFDALIASRLDEVVEVQIIEGERCRALVTV